MSHENPNHAVVRHTPLAGMRTPENLAALDTTCSTGAQCAEVQGSPFAWEALAELQAAVSSGHVSLSRKLTLAQALMAAAKALNLDLKAINLALRGYEAAVAVIAKGDASIMNRAGLLSRALKPASVPLTKVVGVQSKPGKHPKEAILSWPRAPGRNKTYALEVNPTPDDPSAPWTALEAGTSRRRVITAPTPRAQLLARVAAVASDGTTSAWSDVILVTTR